MIRIRLTPPQREELEQIRRIGGIVAQRAQMVLLSNDGHHVPEIAQQLHCSEEKVRTWLHRWEQRGVAGLNDLPHGRPRSS